MRTGKILSITAMLFVSVFCLSAKVTFHPFVSTDIGGAFCYPTADYLKQYPGDPDVSNPPIRTSWSFGVDAFPIGVSIDIPQTECSRLVVGGGISYINVSESVAYGLSVLKPYCGLGFVLDLDYAFDNRMGLGLSYRYLNCRYTGSQSHFLVQEIGIVPSYALVDSSCRLSVCLPVALSIKADAVTLRVSAGLRIGMDVTEGDVR